METEFVFISNQSTDKNLQKYYTNFQKLIDFIKERKLYAENSDFYNKKITEINDIISRDFHEKYDKEVKNIIAKNFSEITVFLADKHNLHKKNKFLAIFLPLGMLFGVALGMTYGPDSSFLGLGYSSGMMVGLIIGIAMDTEVKNEGRQISIGIEDEIVTK